MEDRALSERRQGPVKEKVSEGIGQRLREARKHLHLTQQGLSDLSGHPKSQIAQWEIGARTPAIEGLYSLASSMGISFEWLATGHGGIRADSSSSQEPRFSGPLLRASIRIASEYISKNASHEILDISELAEQVYLAGAAEGYDAPGKTFEVCMEFLEGAAQIRVLTSVSTSKSQAAPTSGPLDLPPDLQAP
jgi:transcriptional regulator with XRE-family HTH domain